MNVLGVEKGIQPTEELLLFGISQINPQGLADRKLAVGQLCGLIKMYSGIFANVVYV
jgi:hypothetical protein